MCVVTFVIHEKMNSNSAVNIRKGKDRKLCWQDETNCKKS